jgi:uncharacterized membrane protein YphA (DoxX/SURF4 family)
MAPTTSRAEGDAQRANGVMLGLRVLSLGLGVFFLAMSLNKIGWLADPTLLTERFERWLPTAAPYARVYLELVAIPGGPVFARLVPIGEFCTALAMFTGVFTNVAAGVALLMILNFHLATGSFSSVEFLRDGTGPPMMAALLALALAGRRLPFALDLRRLSGGAAK